MNKSEGVFVWGRTVLRHIQATATKQTPLGVAPRPPESALAALVAELSAHPSEIDDVYAHLLGQLGPEEKARAAMMFSLVIHNPFAQAPNVLWFG